MSEEEKGAPSYTCDRCDERFDTPQSLRDHQASHVEEGDEEVQEEWEHSPRDPDTEIPGLGGDTDGDVV